MNAHVSSKTGGSFFYVVEENNGDLMVDNMVLIKGWEWFIDDGW